MKDLIRTLIAISLLVTFATFAPAQKKKTIKYYRIPTNQTFHVRMNDSLKSDEARIGDTFTTTVVDPVYSSNGVQLVPPGSMITGRVTAVQKAQKDGNPGTMSVVFYNLGLPNGRAAAIS